MKKNHFFAYLSFAIIVAMSMVIFSCEKEQPGIDTSVNQTDQTLKDQQLKNRIVAFKSKIDLVRTNPSLKAGTTPMEVDSAIWYIEAASNYTYANAGTDYEESIIDSAKIVVPLTNGKVLISAVQLAYDQVIDSLSSHNAAIPESEKQLIVADIALTEADDNTVTLEVTSVFGTDRISVCTNDYPWYWGRALGRCDGTGLGVGKDAADIIEQLARCDIAVPAGNAYYTDVVFEWITGCEYQNENGDCLIFENYQEYVLVHPCLSASEISFYKNGLLTVCNLLKPSSQHSIIGFDFYDDEAHGLLPDFGDYWVLVHKADIEYGIWHSSGEPPAEL